MKIFHADIGFSLLNIRNKNYYKGVVCFDNSSEYSAVKSKFNCDILPCSNVQEIIEDCKQSNIYREYGDPPINSVKKINKKVDIQKQHEKKN